MRARAAVALVVIALSGRTSQAQSDDSIATQNPRYVVSQRSDTVAGDRGWLIAFSAGVPGYGSESLAQLMTVGVQWTRARPLRPGGDFALGTMPYALSQGVAVLGVRAGVAVPVPVVPGVMLLPSGGVSALGGLSPGGAGGLLGLNAGVAAVAMGRSGVGARVGMTFHHFDDSNGAIWLLEMGMVTGRGR